MGDHKFIISNSSVLRWSWLPALGPIEDHAPFSLCVPARKKDLRHSHNSVDINNDDDDAFQHFNFAKALKNNNLTSDS
jgi:hypothetical protein